MLARPGHPFRENYYHWDKITDFSRTPRIFILEGLLTVVCGVAGKWWIPDWPETAKFLTDEERVMLLARLSADTGGAVMDRLDKRATMRIITDWKIYAGAFAFMCVSSNGYAGSVSRSNIEIPPPDRRHR